MEKKNKRKDQWHQQLKLWPGLIVLENSNLEETVEVSAKAAGTGGSRLGLKKGAKITIRDLLYGLLLCSGNDAAVALAQAVGGSIEGFAQMMNNKAKELGLENTQFVTPHGLDADGHFTTAYELAILTNYALQNETFAKIVKTKNYTVTINGYPKTISNTNELLGYLNGVYGVKTGFTNGANRCLVTAAKREDLDIICVVLGADTKKDRTKDSVKLIEYAFENYTMYNIGEIITKEYEEWKSQNINNFYIDKGVTNNVEISLENEPYSLIPIKKTDIEKIKVNINCNFEYSSPLEIDTNLGNLDLKIGEEIICSLQIKNTNKVEKKGIYDYFLQLLKQYSKSFEYFKIQQFGKRFT